jgi:hypothetical protein
MKNRKIIIIALVIILLFSSVGISTGFFNKIISSCKAFIYCKGKQIEKK